jgi:hypothetical protein
MGFTPYKKRDFICCHGDIRLGFINQVAYADAVALQCSAFNMQRLDTIQPQGSEHA